MRRRLIPPQQPFLGMGTAGSPYRIATAEQLADLATKVNSGATDTLRGGLYQDKHYLQVAHLDLGAYANWVPIGSLANRFFGIYNGNGLSVSNLSCTHNRAGLFGAVSGTVKNLRLASGIVKNTGANAIIGGIASATSLNTGAEIKNCTNNASIVAQSELGYCYAGGITGYQGSSSPIENCMNTGSVENNFVGRLSAGGIVGVAPGGLKISNCFNGGEVFGTGVIGAINGAGCTLSNCYYDADTSGATQANATGLTTAQCTGAAAQTNMPNLDWVNVWRTNEDGYPTLRVFDK